MRRWRAEEREEAGYLQLRVGRAMDSRGLLSGYSGDRRCVPLLCRLRCVRRIRACSVSAVYGRGSWRCWCWCYCRCGVRESLAPVSSELVLFHLWRGGSLTRITTAPPLPHSVPWHLFQHDMIPRPGDAHPQSARTRLAASPPPAIGATMGLYDRDSCEDRGRTGCVSCH
jgi:hypothetical protein